MHMSHGHQPGSVHFNDVEYDAYLAHDRTLADSDVVRIEAGGRVRLRIINAAAGTNFLIDLGPLPELSQWLSRHCVLDFASRS